MKSLAAMNSYGLHAHCPGASGVARCDGRRPHPSFSFDRWSERAVPAPYSGPRDGYDIRQEDKYPSRVGSGAAEPPAGLD